MAGMQTTFIAIKTKCIVSATFQHSKLIFACIIFIFLFSSLLQARWRLHCTKLRHLKPIISNTRSTAFILEDLVISFQNLFSILTPHYYEKAVWGMRTLLGTPICNAVHVQHWKSPWVVWPKKQCDEIPS